MMAMAPSTWLLTGLRGAAEPGKAGAMTRTACPSYAGYGFPAEIISHAVWLYVRFPLSLRMLDEPLATRGIVVSHRSSTGSKWG